MLPDWYFATIVGILGAVIGSFLNVVIYRLHTGKSINGHSHCLSCAQRLAWYELVPVVSYLVLHGRCRTCQSYIPFRYVVVELLTAGAFLVLFQLTSDFVLLVLYFLLIATLIVTAVYDFYHLIIPNELPLILGGIAVVILGYESLAAFSLLSLGLSLLSGAIGYGFYAGLWLISGGRWLGLGDAKLALPLALLLPLSAVASFILLSFWVGALVSILILVVPGVVRWGRHQLVRWRRRPAAYTTSALAIPPKYFTMKSEVPFAPFIIVAFLLTYFFDISAFGLTDYVLTLFL